MSIVNLRKITVYGHSDDKSTIISELQKLGCLHLISLTLDQGLPDYHNLPLELKDALEHILQSPRMQHQVLDTSQFDALSVQQQLLSNKHQLRTLRDEKDVLQQHIKTLKPWGDFDFYTLADMQDLRFWFYRVPHSLLNKLPADIICQSISSDNRFQYVVVIAKDEPANMPVKRTRTKEKSVNAMKKRLDTIGLAIEELEVERFSLTRWCQLFINNVNQLQDQNACASADAMSLSNSAVFAIQAWAPEHRVDDLLACAELFGLCLDVRSPHKEEQPPTLLHNRNNLRGGESLVNFYMTPNYWNWDPSVLVFVSFALFFGMILADAGYALVLGTALVYFWKKLSASESLRHLRNIAVALVAGTFCYGVMTGSYFGITLPPQSVLENLKVLDLSDAGTMMLLSITIGVIHLVIANLMNAYSQRHERTAFAPIGWALMIVSGYVFWCSLQWLPNIGLNIAATIGFGIGTLLVVFFSVATGSAIRRLSLGVLSLSKVINAFGDVMSYLRLFALGLASASLAAAFNDMAMQIRSSTSGLGLLIALLVLLLGHAMNLALGLISAVVHGLRLNVIEFFNWGLGDEGNHYRVFKQHNDTLMPP